MRPHSNDETSSQTMEATNERWKIIKIFELKIDDYYQGSETTTTEIYPL